MKKIHFLFTFILLLSVSACGSKSGDHNGASINGTFVTDDRGSFVFSNDGTVIIKGRQSETHKTYKMEGNKIIVDGMAANLTLQNDGSIDGGALGVLKETK